MKIKFQNPVSYSQVSQSSSTTFAFLHENEDGSFEELFYPVKCRDFLGDCVFKQQKGGTVYTYGFTAPEKLDEEETKLSVHFGNKEELERFLKNREYLAEIEFQNGLIGHNCWHDGDVLIIKGDPFWQSAIWTISLFTHLIRCLSSHEEWDSLFEPTEEDVYKTSYREREYMRRIGRENWEKLINNLQEIKSLSNDCSGWNLDIFGSSIHNCSGIASLFSSTGMKGNIYSEGFKAL